MAARAEKLDIITEAMWEGIRLAFIRSVPVAIVVYARRKEHLIGKVAMDFSQVPPTEAGKQLIASVDSWEDPRNKLRWLLKISFPKESVPIEVVELSLGHYYAVVGVRAAKREAKRVASRILRHAMTAGA